jgi:molybdenum cofactor guanylyltransferase
MGTDKALLQIKGETLLARTVRVVSAVATEVLIVGRTELPIGMGHVPAIEDVYPDTGPLGGIASGLARIGEERALVVACDLPFVRTEVLRLLLDLAPGYDAVVPRVGQGVPGDSGQARGPVPTDGAESGESRSGGQAQRPAPTERLPGRAFPSTALRGRGQGKGCARAQPTCAVYARSCLPVMQRHLETGRYRLNDLLNELRVRWVEEEEIRCVDPQLHSFLNANTPGEWDEIVREFQSIVDHSR